MTRDEAQKLADEVNKEADLYEAILGETGPGSNIWGITIIGMLFTKADMNRILSIIGDRDYYIDFRNGEGVLINTVED